MQARHAKKWHRKKKTDPNPRCERERVAGCQGSRPHIFSSSPSCWPHDIPLAFPCCQHCSDEPSTGGECRTGGPWRGGELRGDRASKPGQVPVSLLHPHPPCWPRTRSPQRIRAQFAARAQIINMRAVRAFVLGEVGGMLHSVQQGGSPALDTSCEEEGSVSGRRPWIQI